MWFQRHLRFPRARDRTVILVDDGLAMGATMRATAVALRQQQPKRIVVTVPVAAPETCEELRTEIDDILSTPLIRPPQALSRHDPHGRTHQRVDPLAMYIISKQRLGAEQVYQRIKHHVALGETFKGAGRPLLAAAGAKEATCS